MHTTVTFQRHRHVVPDCISVLQTEAEGASETSRFIKKMDDVKNPKKEDYVGGMQSGCFIYFIDKLAVRCGWTQFRKIDS
jgi:hypothetical protein